MDGRGLTRRLLKWSAIGIGVLVVTAAIGSFALHTYGSFRLERARSDFDLRWGHLTEHPNPPNVPDHENGARWLVAGGRAILCSLEDRRFFGQLSERPAATWTDAERSRALWILHEQQNALEILLRSGSFKDFNLDNNGIRATHDQIDFSSIVMGLRLLLLEARLAWSEGRSADCLAALNAIGRSADGLLKTPIVTTSIIGSAATRWSALATADVVDDPCAGVSTLENLNAALPTEDPIRCSTVTLAVSIAEIADEGLEYIDDLHDPSMGWSIPFWVSNRYLLEDLFVAEILDRWGRHLELTQLPAANWPPNAAHSIWDGPQWPPWLALSGRITPNLLNGASREQAASAQLQQIRTAIKVRFAALDGLGRQACGGLSGSQPNALTGEPIACRYLEQSDAIVIEIPGAVEAMRPHVSKEKLTAAFPAIRVPVTLETDDCD